MRVNRASQGAAVLLLAFSLSVLGVTAPVVARASSNRAATPASSTPSLVVIGDYNFTGNSVNDDDVVVGELWNGSQYNGAVWHNGSFSTLSPLDAGETNGGTAGGGYITNSGTVYGETNYPNVGQDRATKWSSSGGAGTDMGADNAPSETQWGTYNQFTSGVTAVSPNGKDAGFTTHCYGTDGNGVPNNCEGPFPAEGDPLKPIVPLPGTADEAANSPEIGGVIAVNDSGEAVSVNSSGHGEIIGGATFDFAPQAIADDGAIYGYGKRRAPNGTETNLTCGGFVYNVNSSGDVLAGNGSVVQLEHDGRCYPVSSLVPSSDADADWSFPQVQTGDEINNNGQMLLQGVRSGSNVTVSVLLTPQYPFAATISARSTSTPGRYDFSTTVTGTDEPTTTTWNFGDGDTTTSAGSGTVTHRYTTPGTHLVTAVVVDSTDGLSTTVTKTITVPAPSLSVSISTPGHKADKLPPKSTVKVEVVVKASRDGVGELSHLTFHGGEFTSSRKNVLKFTTAATPPFGIAPGDGRTFTVKVKTAGEGSTTVSSVLTGQDAAKRKVSASDKQELRIKKG